VIEAFGAPRRFNARFCLGHVRAGLACVYESTPPKAIACQNVPRAQLPPTAGHRWACKHTTVAPRSRIMCRRWMESHPPPGIIIAPTRFAPSTRSPEPDERAKREWQEHAVCGSCLRTFQDVSPAIAPPIPTLGSVQHAQRSAGGARGLVYACVSVQGESRVGCRTGGSSSCARTSSDLQVKGSFWRSLSD